MGMERGLTRLMRAAAASSPSSSVAQLACGSGLFMGVGVGWGQRGAALWSSQMREYASAPSGGFSLMETRQSVVDKRRPVWQEWIRGYADSSVEKDDALQGNVEYLEFGTHKSTTAKRYAVGKTAIGVVEVQDGQVDDGTKEKAKAILQQVGEKIEETVEEAKRRQLQEKLAATEGIGEVVHELYNQHGDHTKYSQTEADEKA